MHKFIYNPILLDKILDDYWNENKFYLTTVLVKQEIAQITNERKKGKVRAHNKQATKFIKPIEKINIQAIEYQDVLKA